MIVGQSTASGEDRAKKVAVEVGLTDGRYTAINGLNPGDTVAADNTGQLYDGAPVYIFNQRGDAA